MLPLGQSDTALCISCSSCLDTWHVHLMQSYSEGPRNLYSFCHQVHVRSWASAFVRLALCYWCCPGPRCERSAVPLTLRRAILCSRTSWISHCPPPSTRTCSAARRLAAPARLHNDRTPNFNSTSKEFAQCCCVALGFASDTLQDETREDVLGLA